MDNLSKIQLILSEFKRLKRAGVCIEDEIIGYAEDLVREHSLEAICANSIDQGRNIMEWDHDF